MELPELRRRHGAVDGVAEQLMAEVVVALVDVLERMEDRRVDELVDRRLQLGKGPADQAGDDVWTEATADDGPRASDESGVLRESREPGEDGVADRVGDVRLADPLAVGSSVVVEG